MNSPASLHLDQARYSTQSMCMFKRPFTPGWALQKYSEQVRDAGEHTLAIVIALALAHNISSAAVSARAVAVTKFR